MRVILDLISPGNRRIQATRELRGCWDHTYTGAKKELKSRYPAHP